MHVPCGVQASFNEISHRVFALAGLGEAEAQAGSGGRFTRAAKMCDSLRVLLGCSDIAGLTWKHES